MQKPWQCLALLALAGCSAENYIIRERIADTPMPQTSMSEVNFAPLIEQRVDSASVYTEPLDRELMKRVLLGPNLTFEASRSSLDEPPTIGPSVGNGNDTPNLKDALGHGIPIRLSSSLMNYLSRAGSVMLAPAVTRRFGWEWWCTRDWCPKTTWVERLLLLYSRKPDGKDAAVNMSGRELRQEDLPTSALAVRDIGIGSVRVNVTAIQNPDGSIEFRPARSVGGSVCPEVEALDLPVITFSAEIVSMKDGRIIARIHEARSPKLSVPMRWRIQTNTFDPLTDVGYTKWKGRKPWDGKYQYVKGWTPRNVACASAVSAYQTMLRQLNEQLEQQQEATLQEIFKQTLDRLYVK